MRQFFGGVSENDKSLYNINENLNVDFLLKKKYGNSIRCIKEFSFLDVYVKSIHHVHL